MTINQSMPASGFLSWLEWGESELSFLDSREARLECEEILKELSGLSRSELYLARETIDPHIFSGFKERIGERKKRIPLAYILKKAPFWEAELEVRPGVFIPRPETEILIEGFLKNSGFGQDQAFQFLDLGTGSGNIAVTIAGIFKKARGLAVDLSREALDQSESNARRLGVRDRLNFIQADGLEAFKEKSFDVIFSNPPYVGSEELRSLEPEISWEPPRAFAAGIDGLDFYRRIFNHLSSLPPAATALLKPGGSLWLEVGWNQAGDVKSFFEKAGFGLTRIFRDFNGIERIVSGMNYVPHPRPLPQGEGKGEGKGKSWKN